MVTRKHSLYKKILMACALFLWGGAFYASDWILAAAPFEFNQAGPHSSVQEKTARLLPQMILDEIGSGDTRLPPRTEMLDRKLSSLRNERQSLFLQLSAAIKARDSVFLRETNKKKLEKKIQEQEKKIKEIQDKIQKNLEDSEKAVSQVQAELSGEEKEKKNFFQALAAFFSDKDEQLVPGSVNESVKIYRDDSSALLSPGQEIWDTGMESQDFISFMERESVNGYLTGSLTFFGDYFSVSVELKIYPDGKSAGTVMEVGSLDNMVQVAKNLSQYLRPIVVNSSPVQLYFDIVPEDAAKKSKVMIDGTLVNLNENSVPVSAGIHTVSVESPGYASSVTTYNFKDSPGFFIHVPMVAPQAGQVNVYLKNPMEGTLFAGGKEIGDGIYGGSVSINGSPVIGYFKNDQQETDSGENPDAFLGAFYYIPAKLQNDGENLVINVNPIDTASLIENRRIWAYRGYTALIMTLPVTFFTIGNYNTALNGYRKGYVDAQTVNGWSYARTGSIALTAAAGGFFIYELVRYLHAASSVLPSNAKKASNQSMMKIQDAIQVFEAEKTDSTDGIVEEESSPDMETVIENLN